MTIRPSRDVATRASAELSGLLERIASDPDRETQASLGEARGILRRHGTPQARETEYLHPKDRDSLLVELDALIDEYGEDALAADFVGAWASEAMSRLIEAVASDRNLPRRPTLGVVREAMAQGLVAKLTGDGALDEDDDAALFAEIDELIRRHGEDALAESLIRYE